jgi:kynurenine formamidase
MESTPPGQTAHWGRWGAEDERGALNLIDDQTVLDAIRTPREGRVYHLGLPVQRTDVPTVDYRGPAQRLTLVSHADAEMFRAYEAGEGDGANEDVLVVPTHSGTHMDALAHVFFDGRMYNGFPAGSFASYGGAARCGIEKVGSVVGRGVLLDVARLHGVPRLDAGYVITGTDLERAADAARVTLRRGDVLLVHTGWLSGFRADAADGIIAQPGLGLDAAAFVLEHDIAAVGADNSAVEAIPFDGGEFMSVHRALLVGGGVPFIEHVRLDELAADERTEFLFVAAPLPITGASGSPLNPLAIV